LRAREDAFGGRSKQHDSAEFLNFLVEVLDDELNPNRDNERLNIVGSPTAEEERLLNKRPYLWGCNDRWKAFLTTEDSIITREMKGLLLSAMKCQVCGNERRAWANFTYITLRIATDTDTQSFDAAIRNQFGNQSAETLEATCDSDRCKDTGQREWRRSFYLAHMPNYLVIQLNRYTSDSQKVKTRITFPQKGLDLTPVFASTAGAAEFGLPSYKGQTGPFKYDCYAVTQHAGAGTNSGHYWTLAQRSTRSANGRGVQDGWWQFNDQLVEPCKSGFEATQTNKTSIIFLKRQNISR
jgi:ubiquitin carboxyl-terminal hydrolase 8